MWSVFHYQWSKGRRGYGWNRVSNPTVWIGRWEMATGRNGREEVLVVSCEPLDPWNQQEIRLRNGVPECGVKWNLIVYSTHICMHACMYIHTCKQLMFTSPYAHFYSILFHSIRVLLNAHGGEWMRERRRRDIENNSIIRKHRLDKRALKVDRITCDPSRNGQAVRFINARPAERDAIKLWHRSTHTCT